jgi:hypothetical protein
MKWLVALIAQAHKTSVNIRSRMFHHQCITYDVFNWSLCQTPHNQLTKKKDALHSLRGFSL